MSDETLMSAAEAAATDTTQAAQPGQTTDTTPAGQTAAPADGAPAADANPADTQDAQTQPEGAPEAYAFQAPEGLVLDESVTGALGEVAKELNLSQANAQKVVDKMAPLLAQRQADQIQAMQSEWRDQATADKDFGGEKLSENLGVARKALDAFGTPELKQMLEQTGLGNHPEVIRFFVKTGRAMSEDQLVTGKATSPKDDAKRYYPNSNMN